MRMKPLLTAAAPLALLAACGEATPVEEFEPQPMETAPAAVVDLPEIPANSLGTVDFPGSYSRMGSTLVLDEDGTYDFLAANGERITGTYSRMEDGSRIRLEDFDGGPAFFSVGRDAIYRLPSEATPYNEITVEGEYRRNLATPSPAGTATATAAAED